MNLQHLCIGNDILLEGDFASLINTLDINHSIKSLEFHWVVFPSRKVWRKFATWLKSPNATLLELSICGTRINTKEKIEILMSLKENKSIKKVNFEWTGDSEPGLSMGLSRLLCDKTSIDNTYNSNHTLHTFLVGTWNDDNEIPSKVSTLLKLNELDNKLKVARHKVLYVHFPEDATANRTLLRLSESILPHVLSWLGRDEHEFSAMYNAVQCFLFLFDSHRDTASVDSDKRKSSL
jgi:hypothetical protein